MATKSLYELKQEKNGGSKKNKNTITDADYKLRDKRDPKDKKNTVWMTPNPAEVTRRLEKLKQEKLEAEELALLEAEVADRDESPVEDEEATTEVKQPRTRKTTTKAK